MIYSVDKEAKTLQITFDEGDIRDCIIDPHVLPLFIDIAWKKSKNELKEMLGIDDKPIMQFKAIIKRKDAKRWKANINKDVWEWEVLPPDVWPEQYKGLDPDEDIYYVRMKMQNNDRP